MYRSIGLRALAGACVLVLFGLLSGCGSGSSSSDWFYHWNCNGDPECLATNPTGAPVGTADEGNQTSCDELLTFGNKFWGIPPATQSCDQDPNGSSGSGGGGTGVTVSGFTPASTAPGNNITITGTGFSTSGTTVTVNGVTCAVVTVSSTQIVCTLGAMGDLTGPIVVDGVSSTGSLEVFNHFYGVGASGAQAVAVGANTTLAGSTNGSTWNAVNLASANFLSAVAVSGVSFYTYVTVGQNGSVYLNNTGSSSWLLQTSGTSANLFGVATSGSLFVAVGASGTIITSPTGATWTARTSNTSQTLAGVAWCSTQFVAVGNNGVIDTSPDGVTWTPRTSGTTDFLDGVGCSGSIIVVGAGNQTTGGEIFSSPDGITWTPHALPSADAVYGVAWSGSTFVAAGFGGVIYTSSNGTSWTPRTSGSTQSLNAVAWFGGQSQFVVVGGFGTILTSADGISWTPRTP